MTPIGQSGNVGLPEAHGASKLVPTARLGIRRVIAHSMPCIARSPVERSAAGRYKAETMCGRYTLSETPEWSDLDIGVPEELLVTPRYNAAPGRPQLIVTQPLAPARHTREPLELRERPWGVTLGGRRVINARIESLERPAWRAHVGRCVVPCDGYVEWSADDGGKQPVWLRAMDPATRVLWMAGLVLPDGFVVITTEASGDVRAIHPRMPAFVPRAQLDAWLTGPREGSSARLARAPDGLLYPTRLTTRINATTNDDPRCLLPADARSPSPDAPARDARVTHNGGDAHDAPGHEGARRTTAATSRGATTQLSLFGPADER
ncbi:MAG: SOS response-associated peptidase [Polyangiales bacterium]|nr:SOS response-associated peptidase [Myxococcales bacterium]MCB9656797.1 SOS response-associated peptidase [Sandaracinaceae bacterium]